MWKLDYVSSSDGKSDSTMWPKMNPNLVDTQKCSGLMQFVIEATKNGVTLVIRPDKYGRFVINGHKGTLNFSQVVAPWVFEASRGAGAYEEQLLLALRKWLNDIEKG